MEKYQELGALNTINLHNAKNETLNTFIKLFIPEVEGCEALCQKYPEQVANLNATALKYENCLLNHRFSELTLTPGMDWPFDVPAPEGWTKVIFRDKDGRETVKLYRNGSSVYTQGGYPENAPGYEWIGIHAILNGTTHTITEAVE